MKGEEQGGKEMKGEGGRREGIWDKKDVKRRPVIWGDAPQQHLWWLLPPGLPAALPMPLYPRPLQARHRLQPPLASSCLRSGGWWCMCLRRKRPRMQCREGGGQGGGPSSASSRLRFMSDCLLFHVPTPCPHTQVSSRERASGVGEGWPRRGTCHTGLGAGGQA